MNYLFYSKKCQTSINLIHLMNSVNILQNIKMMCVDDMLDRVPKNITEVPTLILHDRGPLKPSEAFKWVESIKFLNYQKANEINNIIVANQKKLENINNIGTPAFIKTEMGNFSDTYTLANPLTNAALTQTFYNLDIDTNNVIMTPPQEVTKVKETEQKKKIAEIDFERKKQDKDINNILKQDQFDAITVNEYKKSQILKNKIINNK